ncbi:Zinc finger CCCH domain-containing protein 53 [Apostasia shenzhenica]|uniref:Zinc finger CCCH domain-containing protein 53 n=1 Tax=Apostasia shenzhenica TaxID=1088818 RepID=A0A2I0BCV7_9ASPA|nr:Zinc finger CCCH domain-containing protein 53 [Apostasia shenzhenica]
MEFPFSGDHHRHHHHHRLPEDEEDDRRRHQGGDAFDVPYPRPPPPGSAYPPPGVHHVLHEPGFAPPPALAGGTVHHLSHESGYAPPPSYAGNPVYHASHEPGQGFAPPPPFIGAAVEPYPPPPFGGPVQHVAHDFPYAGGGHHRRPGYAENVSHHGWEGEALSRQPTVRIFTKAEENYSLSIRDGKVILARKDPNDPYQHWIKDLKYSTKVKDEEGFPSFALVNKATGEALKHSTGATHPVRLVPYNPDYLDESVLWAESKDLGDSFRCIRMVNNIRLNFDAFHGDKDHGGVRDGTILVLWEWLKGNNQRMKCGSNHGHLLYHGSSYWHYEHAKYHMEKDLPVKNKLRYGSNSSLAEIKSSMLSFRKTIPSANSDILSALAREREGEGEGEGVRQSSEEQGIDSRKRREGSEVSGAEGSENYFKRSGSTHGLPLSASPPEEAQRERNREAIDEQSCGFLQSSNKANLFSFLLSLPPFLSFSLSFPCFNKLQEDLRRAEEGEEDCSAMDAYEATKVVFSRIQSLDPENAAKIMGFLLIQDHGEKEMIRLAFGPEALLHSVIVNARKELGFLPPASPSAASPPASNHFVLPRQNSSSRLIVPPPLPPLSLPSPSSLAQPSPFSRFNGTAADDIHPGGEELIDELQLPGGGGCGEIFYPEECRSPIGSDLFPYGLGWTGAAVNGCAANRRSCSISDLCGADPAGLGWKPCLYFARGYCKNGSSCRFLHGLPDATASVAAGKMDADVDQELLLRSKSQRLMASAAAAYPYSPTGSLPSPLSPSGKCMSFLLQQQQSESQRSAATAAAAAALILGGEDPHKFIGRPRMERCDFSGMANPGSRQIYLTFPADSTFREEDVSNYFSIYGPVQDVRIPYQQKRMFGFVTFVYPETVKLILAKGNPHFVCDARVLVKPYKEKGKIPDKYRHFLLYISLSLYISSYLNLRRLQQKAAAGREGGFLRRQHSYRDRIQRSIRSPAARILYGGGNHDTLLRRKIEEQQELQQAIEFQQQRFIGLQLLGLNRNLPASVAVAGAVSTPPPLPVTTAVDGDKSLRPWSPRDLPEEASPKKDDDFQESAEHNLPDSPFASPTKSSIAAGDSFAVAKDVPAPAPATSASSTFLASTLLPATSTLESMAPFKSCFFHVPRFDPFSINGFR